MAYILKKGVKKNAHNIGGNDSSKDDPSDNEEEIE